MSVTNCEYFVWRRLSFGLSIVLILVASVARGEVSFSRDVRPILSDACFQCHGADQSSRQANLRFDQLGVHSEIAQEAVIVAGNSAASELIVRITSTDPDIQMPPEDFERQLTAAEIRTLRDWIDQGALSTRHWSFVPPSVSRSPLKTRQSTQDWAINTIDHFVFDKLASNGLSPSPLVDHETLARRAALTLTGLPPSPETLNAFLLDNSVNAYDRYLDLLMTSTRYGEHLATIWLDLARYADTDGYQDDEPRIMWRWRDWLIDAINRGMPFDQFTREVLAGDLLSNATPTQILATGFHRNHRTNGEGGSIEEEFRLAYVSDCLETTGTVWLGLTLGCAKCHDHKYDPISQREYFQLFDFFNKTPEKGVYRGNNSPPLLKVPTALQRRKLEMRNLSDGTSADSRSLPQTTSIEAAIPDTMVMADGVNRTTFVLERGQYDQPGEKVRAEVPKSLPPLSPHTPRNRLGLAQWLVDARNPLTARVEVNRIWAVHFGTGLVRTAEDFGSQGEPPSHPELLDWLATELIRHDWDVKKIHRLIVTSATYRQAAAVRDAAFTADPENRWLWRFPRRRLAAEQLRDQALFVSGLLVEQLGGPSVKPRQPEGLWDELAGGSSNAYKDGYQVDHGAGLYRRSLYTFWRRTIPPPSMATFDAPSRESCTARRDRTNTPLQALSLLNDTTYLEAAKQLAISTTQANTATRDDRLRTIFRRALLRSPTQEELSLLQRSYITLKQAFEGDVDSANKLATAGQTDLSPIAVTDLAAYVSVGNILLNLDEFLVVE